MTTNVLRKTKFCQGISDISDTYMGFIIDQWGVLHNGEQPYDGVIDCLKKLKERHKHIIILSNSGKRAEPNIERLKTMGITPDLYNTLLTSGEMAWQGMKDQSDGFFKNLGKRVYVISRGGDRSIVDGLDLEVVDDVKDADFMVISGADSPEKTIEDYEPILKGAVRKQLTALCANPDSRGVMGRDYIMGPGTLARRYMDFGGVVHYIGKPHLPIFQRCIKILQEHEIYPGHTIMIGDTMTHDIVGGHMANLDTCLVKSGLHAPAFHKCQTPKDVDKSLMILTNHYNNIRPTYLVNTLSWGKALPDRKHRKRG